MAGCKQVSLHGCVAFLKFHHVCLVGLGAFSCCFDAYTKHYQGAAAAEDANKTKNLAVSVERIHYVCSLFHFAVYLRTVHLNRSISEEYCLPYDNRLFLSSQYGSLSQTYSTASLFRFFWVFCFFILSFFSVRLCIVLVVLGMFSQPLHSSLPSLLLRFPSCATHVGIVLVHTRLMRYLGFDVARLWVRGNEV